MSKDLTSVYRDRSNIYARFVVSDIAAGDNAVKKYGNPNCTAVNIQQTCLRLRHRIRAVPYYYATHHPKKLAYKKYKEPGNSRLVT